MLTLYQALIRSTIDYGYNNLWFIIRNIIIELLGATKTTPVKALLVEVNEMPLRLRRVKLSLVFWTSLKELQWK